MLGEKRERGQRELRQRELFFFFFGHSGFYFILKFYFPSTVHIQYYFVLVLVSDVQYSG